MKTRHILAYAALAAVIGAMPPARAAVREGAVDVVVVLDSSGSMKRTDPRFLRRAATKLLFSLLETQDRVALVSFSDQGYPVMFLTALDTPANAAKARALVDRISSKGAYTNLHGALQAALKVFAAAGGPGSDVTRVVILMSDGIMDVGDAARDRELATRIETELLGQIRAQNIAVHTVAFTADSAVALLRKIAVDTNGVFHLATTARDLHGIFAALFENMKAPDMLPMHGDQFHVDAHVDAVKLLASKTEAKTPIRVETPDGRQLTAAEPGDQAQWYATEAFDLVAIPAPIQGNWTMANGAPDKSSAYAETALSLVTDFDASYLPLQRAARLTVWLADDQGRVSDAAKLAGIEFSMEVGTPDGARRVVAMADRGASGDVTAGDGVYSLQFTPQVDGRYQLRLLARGQNFERQRKIVFDVLPVEPGTAPAAAPTTAGPAIAIEQEPPPVAAAPPPVAPAPPAPPPVAPPAAPRRMVSSERLRLGVLIGSVNLLIGLLAWRYLRREPEETAL